MRDEIRELLEYEAVRALNPDLMIDQDAFDALDIQSQNQHSEIQKTGKFINTETEVYKINLPSKNYGTKVLIF